MEVASLHLSTHSQITGATASPKQQVTLPSFARAARSALFPSTAINHSSTTTVGCIPPITKSFRVRCSSLPFSKQQNTQVLKEKLLQAIAPLDRGANASPAEQSRINQIVQELESVNYTRDTLKSPLLNGKWELLYTTSASILKTERPKFLRPLGPIFQAINTDTLRAQNLETWPFFNQVTANLTPLSGMKVAVKFDVFKIGGLISIKAPGRAQGELEITYVDEELRISRGDKGNLFVLKMVDPTYRVPM